MYETCKSCGTKFDLDESILSSKIKWLKCSVCNEKWSFSFKKSTVDNGEKINNNEKSIPTDTNSKDKNEKVKQELASIKSVVEDKSKKMHPKNNPVLDIKNKSVAEIASELSNSKIGSNYEKESKISKKNLKIKKSNFIYVSLILSTIIFASLLFFRSALLGYSFFYYPIYTEKYAEKINEAFSIIELPIFAELNHINLTDFVAIVQKNNIEFSGVIKNISSRPLLVPRIKVLVIREDRKILIEKNILIKNRVILPSKVIEFKDFINMRLKEENVIVKATILKKIF
ncbi:zinc-ribbon domain-containing protein [Alphaproteobacteria bacterium]|nr:zinc-ribbon domain-containing protein [Alphaproteobacteria bacterium]